MYEKEALRVIEKFHRDLPKFSDGRINYTNSDTAPIITIFVKCEDEILLLKRSDKVSNYRGKWSVVAGYLDELKSVKEKVLEEIQEELKLTSDLIQSIAIREPYDFVDGSLNKTWLVY